MHRKALWDRVYRERAAEQVSWYQSVPQPSLEMIAASGVSKERPVIDVGGGASNLVDHLLAAGWDNVTVLDLSAIALEHARQRLGATAGRAAWIKADITTFEPPQRYALWHDRAVLHFLTDADDRARYRAVLRAALEPGGHIIIGSFAPDGPDRCSGLPVVRYDAEALAALLGEEFRLEDERHVVHQTPWQVAQNFLFCRFRLLPS